MMKKIYVICAITLLGQNFNIESKNSRPIQQEKSIKKDIAALKKDLKDLKVNNPKSPQIQETQEKITQLKKDLKQLRKEEVTSNTFSNKTSDIEARAYHDANNSQTTIHAKYVEFSSTPTNDIHEKYKAYFWEH